MNPQDLPRIVTPTQMRSIDDRAISGMGIPALTLMENAGRGIADFIRDRILNGECTGVRIGIVCGRGNNGGDGFVAARHLSAAGAMATVFLMGTTAQLKGDAQTNAARLQELGLEITELHDNSTAPAFADFDLLIDAIFGTGFRGPIEGLAAAVIESMNGSGTRIVAVDSPSGLNGESGQLADTFVQADYTVAFASPKRGQMIWPGRSAVGHLEIIDIGIPDSAIAEEDVRLSLITEEFVQPALPGRPGDGHKGTFGKAMIIGGAVGMTGAVALATQAALRTGLGLTYAGVPSSVADAVDVGSTETVVLPLPEVRARRVLARRSLGEIVKRWESVDATAIGPGLGTHHETQDLVRRLIARRARPTVLDADGLNACAKDPTVLQAENKAPLIITPHSAEMARLLGEEVESIAADRERAARTAAQRFGCLVVMKGAPTFVAEPGGDLFLNPTGNAGMASGGTGDVLTGIIVSFLAQGCEPLFAALLGVYIHGLAGDFAASETGERALVASDVVSALPDVLVHLDR